jgi:hypothetical protein
MISNNDNDDDDDDPGAMKRFMGGEDRQTDSKSRQHY